jgi:hypothetical protein
MLDEIGRENSIPVLTIRTDCVFSGKMEITMRVYLKMAKTFMRSQSRKRRIHKSNKLFESIDSWNWQEER